MKTGKDIHIEGEDLEWLANRLATLLEEKFSPSGGNWINEAAAMNLLNISSKTTMLRLRNEGSVRFSQIFKKVILYDRNSILEFINQHVRETF